MPFDTFFIHIQSLLLYLALCEFTVAIFFFYFSSQKVAQDAETSIKFQGVLKSTAMAAAAAHSSTRLVDKFN